MQTGSAPTLDANAQHPPEIRADDPRHLGNLTKKMNMINAQVSSDTKYDPAPPPRVDKNGKPVNEAFIAEVPAGSAKIEGQYIHLIRAGVLLVITGILVTIFDPDLQKILVTSRYGIRFLMGASAMSVISLLFLRNSQRQNEIDIWYPRNE